MSASGAAPIASKPAAVYFLHAKRVLIVLDNCDLVSAHVAKTALAILEHARNVRLMVTSRTPLMVGEVAFTLPPLALDDSVALFTDCAKNAARASSIDRQTAERICRQRDGSPRAIQLCGGAVALDQRRNTS
ncbi:MAG: hypothetical protein ABR508_08865 [Candidatus Baltobacteraceae bacterium]